VAWCIVKYTTVEGRKEKDKWRKKVGKAEIKKERHQSRNK
jgi:hypothetical protein